MPPSELRMVAVFRQDLQLPVGKLAVQAGHAYIMAWTEARKQDPDLAESYLDDLQMKVALGVPDLESLKKIADRAAKRGIPHAMVEDAGRTVFGEPTVTALGIGPMSKTDCNAITRGLLML